MTTPKDKLCPDCKEQLIGRYSDRCASCAMKLRVKNNNGKALGKPFIKGQIAHNKGKKYTEKMKQGFRNYWESIKGKQPKQFNQMGVKQSQETIAKRVSKLIGRKGFNHTKESRIKMSISQKNRFSNNRKIKYYCKDCGKQINGKKATRCLHCAAIFRQTGKRASMSRINKLHHTIKIKYGDMGKIRSSIRKSPEYARWRLGVFERDRHTCQKCGISGVILEAHHIKPFWKIIQENNINSFIDGIECKELWDVSNGITYCVSCHSIVDKARKILGDKKK